MGLKGKTVQLISGFKGYSLYDKVVLCLVVLVSVSLLFYHGFIHTGIVKFSAGKALDCGQNAAAQVHTVEINHNVFDPEQIEASICDRLKFVNKDGVLHQPALGEHPYHLAYPGFEERGLWTDESNEFILSIPGAFSFHDHLNERIEGSLNVSQ